MKDLREKIAETLRLYGEYVYYDGDPKVNGLTEKEATDRILALFPQEQNIKDKRIAELEEMLKESEKIVVKFDKLLPELEAKAERYEKGLKDAKKHLEIALGKGRDMSTTYKIIDQAIKGE
jgi:hypothetical protein